MMTKFEIEQTNAEIRAKRNANIAVLRKRETEAMDILAVIPNGASLELSQERAVVRAELRHIREMIEDEQRALVSLSGESAPGIDDLVEKLVNLHG